MFVGSQPVRGTAAGVPYLAVPPVAGGIRPGRTDAHSTDAHSTDADGTDAADTDTAGIGGIGGTTGAAPVVIAWHLLDAPRSAEAFAAALPLAGLAAWRIYLDLPLCGARQPAEGADRLSQLGYEDAVLKLHGPIIAQAAEEFPAAFADLRNQLGLGDGAVAFVGCSNGAAVAQLVLAETGPPAGISAEAAVLVSPVSRLRPTVDATARLFGITYPWAEQSLAVARRLDFVERAGELAGAGRPAVRLIVGADDDTAGFLDPARELADALTKAYVDPTRVDLVVVPGMGHALAEEPGVEAAPQTASAAAVDRHAVEWLRRHLPMDGRPS